MAIKIGRIAGIPIALDYSWIVIFVLIAWTIGFYVMPAEYPGLSPYDYLFIGVFSSVLLFGSVLVHELAHSIVAKRNGLRIRQITLFLLGGVSEIEEEPKVASLELRMAMAGPLTSFALAGVSGLFWYASALMGTSILLQAPLQYAALVNVIVGAFNLIPAFPMDGGRVLRALLWMRNQDVIRSTRAASLVGRAFAYAMIGGGLLLILTVDFITGLWLVLIGWFISSGSQAALGQTMMREGLRGLTAKDIMTGRVDTVGPDATLEQLSQEFLGLKHNGFPVVSGDELLGCVTMGDLRKVKRDSWNDTRVRAVMTQKEKLILIREGTPASEAASSMTRNTIGRLFVVDDAGRLVGIITRSDIFRTLQVMEGGRGGGVSTSALGGEVTLTAEVGMTLVLEQPEEQGLGWSADFEPGGVGLVSERTTGEPGGPETRQFVFQALSRGTHQVRLRQRPRAEGAPGPGGRAVRTVRYTILVS